MVVRTAKPIILKTLSVKNLKGIALAPIIKKHYYSRHLPIQGEMAFRTCKPGVVQHLCQEN